ncbi:MAG: Ig-like domain-containing protein, partial [Gemmatimonadetes bacterium]|nr:Ig-like domain-containing protein [Gemmatimonadota bacterium]
MHAVESRRTAVAVLTFAAIATACGGGDPPPSGPQPSTPSSLAVHGGSGQQAAAGEAVPLAPSVVVRDAAGEPVAGVTVTFSVVSGGGTIQGATPATDASGVARISRWVLGPSGPQRLTAAVPSLAPVEIQATITPGTEFTTGTIGGAGGTITIDDANSPYDGLTLTAPGGMFPSSTSWNLRTGTLSPTFRAPAGFTVLGPPLLVQTGAMRGNGLMTLEVPVSAGPNDLVFLALHDPVRGVSELLTTIERKAGSVVVATAHLRGDLLPDPATVGTVRAGVATRQDDPQSQVVPILLDIMSLTQATLNRWSIADHGTASHPDGVGAGIAGLQWVASVPSAPRFDGFVKPLDIPGFYAEPGPLAAVELAQDAIAAELLATLGRLGPKLDQLPKAQRDQIVHQNLVAWMRFAQRPALFTFPQPGLSMPGAALVTSADGNGMTVEVPSASAPVSVGIGAVGYAPFTFASGGLVPVGSTIADFSALDGVLTELTRMNVSLSERLAANEALAAQAGLPAVDAEIRPHPNEVWTTATLDNLIARAQGAQVRVLVQKAT